MGCSPWDRKELGTTERLTLTYLVLTSGSWACPEPCIKAALQYAVSLL